jgi:hypothetical protein
MSETHTPGPWRAIKNRNRGFQIGGKVDRPAYFAKVADVRVSEHTTADAHLIAAAPDLLEACEEALATLYDQNSELGKKIRAAISKAKGPAHAD